MPLSAEQLGPEGPWQAGGGGGLRSALGSAVDRWENLAGLCNPSTCLCANQTRRGELLIQLCVA